MKTYLKFIVVAFALFVGATASYAQSNERQRLSREELSEKQAAHIAQKMSMDDATRTKFVDTYCRCQKEIWELGPRNEKRAKGERTEAETEQLLKARFEHSRKVLDIRQKYYEEYGKFLTQKQIARVYQIEKQMMNRLANKGKQRPDGQKGKKRK